MDEEIAKQTQKEIDRAFPDGCEKPNIPLKHLSKPPFRLVFDIILSFSRQFGILLHTIGEEEKTYDPYWKEADKATKVAFLERIITVIKEVSSKPLTVRASKITSGSEPEKTNELLQVLARTAVSTSGDIWNGVELKLKNLLTTATGADDKSASSDGGEGGSNDKEKHRKERKHKRHREKIEKRLTQPDDTTTTSSSTTPTIEVQAVAATRTEEPHMASGSSNSSSAVESGSVAHRDNLTNSLGVDKLEVESNGSSVNGGSEPNNAKERKVKKKHSSSRSSSREKKKHKHHKDKEKNGALSASTDFSGSDSLDTNNVAAHSASSESSHHHNVGAEGENNHVVTSEGGEECGAPHETGHGKKEKHRKKKRSSSKSTDSKTSHSKAPVAQSSLASRPLAEPDPEWEALLSNLSTFNNKANTFMSEYDSRRIPQAAEIENLQQDDQDGTLSSRPNSSTNEFRSVQGIEAAIELQVQRIQQSNSFLEEHNELLVIIKDFVPNKKDENE